MAAVTDEANGMSLTFSVAKVSDTAIVFDMGDIGSATISVASKEDVLRTIKIAIRDYRYAA